MVQGDGIPMTDVNNWVKERRPIVYTLDKGQEIAGTMMYRDGTRRWDPDDRREQLGQGETSDCLYTRQRPRNRWDDDVPRWYKEMGIPMTDVNNWVKERRPIVYPLDDGRRGLVD